VGNQAVELASATLHARGVAHPFQAEPKDQVDTGIDTINTPPESLHDLYHRLLSGPWWLTIGTIVSMVMVANFAFGLYFLWSGGVENARPGSFADAFFFSVETFGTIGYGALHPVSTAAHLGVMVEAMVNILVVALATGLVFSKFSIPTGRMAFSRSPCVFHLDGVRSLVFRVGNLRRNVVVDALVRITLTRGERTKEGLFLYRMLDLKLVRHRSPSLGRTWTLVHRIEGDSPLLTATTESMGKDESEFMVSVTGLDGTSSQTIHARHLYEGTEVLFGRRPADMLRPKPDGRVELDYSRFHDTVPEDTAPERFRS
jgi:inward rectifier potassium channel